MFRTALNMAPVLYIRKHHANTLKGLCGVWGRGGGGWEGVQ